MNPISTEADEESLSSPVLSTSLHSPVLSSATFQIRKLEFENEQDGPSSPVLHKNETQKSKAGNFDSHWSLAMDGLENFSGNFLVPKSVEPHSFQPETETDFQENNKSEGFCSPELGAKRGGALSSDSPEVKTKKTHLNLTTGHKKKMKFHAVTKTDSLSERNSLVSENASHAFLSPQKIFGSRLNQENQCKLLQNLVKKLDTKNAKPDQQEDNYSLHKSVENSLQASKDTSSLDKVQVKPQKLCENAVFDEENSTILSRSEKSKKNIPEKDSKIDSKTNSCLQADVPISPILKTKPLASGKRKSVLNNDEKGIEQGAKFSTPQTNPSKRNLFTSQPCLNILKATLTASPKFNPRIFTADTNKCRTHCSVGPKTYSSVLSPSATREVLTGHAGSKNPTLSPTSNLSPFGEKFSAVSLSNSANISSVSKRLSFHASSAEKRKNKGMAAPHKLKLKKTNHLENQFSKFSEFCKVNTSLTTKSPSNLTIRKAVIKKFDQTKKESNFRNSSDHSESYCDFDGSLSPILEPSVNSESKIDITCDIYSVPEKNEDLCRQHRSPQENKINESRHEYSIDDHVDDKSLSPCLRTPKNFPSNTISSEMSSKFNFTPKKSVKKFKFSLDSGATPSNNSDIDRESHNLNESLSPVLEVHKNVVSETNQKVFMRRAEEDQEDTHIVKIHDISVTAENDESILDDRKILNATILETNQEMEDLSARFNVGVDDDVDCSQAASAISSCNQGLMTIEFSESSGTQRSRISDGNLPCDEIDKVPNTQQNLPPDDDDVHESGKKKKRRYKKGTLSARLNKLLNRMKSETRIWAHEQQDELPNPAAIDLVVDTVAYEMNRWLLKCRIISERIKDDCCDIYFVLLRPTAISNALVSPGMILRVFPTWQTLDLSSPKVKVIFNVDRVKIIQHQSSADSSNSAPDAKQTIQVAETYCSCSRDSVLTACVHNLLSRQILLGPLISSENKQ